MKLGVSNIAWKIKNSESVFRILNKYDIKFIDIAPTVISENINNFDFDFIKLMQKNGFNLSGMQSLLYPHPSISIFDGEEEFEILFTYLKKVFVLAQKLNIKNLVFGSPKNRIIREGKQANYTKKLEVFTRIANEAEKYNCIVCLEPNPVEYGCNFLVNTFETINFIEDINNKNLRLNLDISTTILCNENLDKILEKHINLIEHVHISSPYIRDILKLDHESIRKSLVNHGYQNYVIMECLFEDDDDLKQFEKNVDCFSNEYHKKI